MESTTSVIQDRPIAPILFDQTPQASPNPWTDATDFDDKKAQGSNEDRPLRTPDPDLFDQSIMAGLETVSTPTGTKPQVSTDVLSQFDPLVSLEEEAAREAWKASESHPPPPRTPSPPPPAPSPPPKDAGESVASPPTSPPSGSSPSPFPSLASLARSFSIPTLSRSRPVSVDAAKAVPSPATLSSFAAQQEAPREGTAANKAPPAVESRSSSSSPVARVTEKQETPFDFQRFLDQMKSRGAEPVSKYLRSYVTLGVPCFTLLTLIRVLGFWVTSRSAPSQSMIR